MEPEAPRTKGTTLPWALMEWGVTPGPPAIFKPARSRPDIAAAHLSPRWITTPEALVTLELRTLIPPSESVSHLSTATLSGWQSGHSESFFEAQAPAGNTQTADSSAAKVVVITLAMLLFLHLASPKNSSDWASGKPLGAFLTRSSSSLGLQAGKG